MARRSTRYGTGRIFQRTKRGKDGKLKAFKRYTICYWKDGIEHREATGKSSYSEALAILKDRLNGIMAGKPVEPTESAAAPTTFNIDKVVELIEGDYAANGRKGLRKLQTVRFPHLREYFKDRPLDALARKDLLAYRRQRLLQTIPEGKKNAGRKYSPASVNREVATLCHGLRLAVEEELIATYPKLKKLEESDARSGFFEYLDFLEVQAHVEEHWRDLFTIAYITGWRVDSELCTMKWTQVDFANKRFRLEPGMAKSRKSREFKWTPALEQAMKNQRARVNALQKEHDKIINHVFPRPETLLALKSCYKIFKEAAIAAGRPKALVHDFRRTAVRNLERAGVPRTTAMAMVGMKTESIYRRYGIVDDAMLEMGTSKLSAYEKDMQAAAKKESAG